ncbi:MAG: RNA polymerase sigma factor [Acidimicrobiales bacterium]
MFATEMLDTGQLIKAVLAGDQEAQTQLYYRHRNLMFGVGSRQGLPSHELDDCVQIAWERAMSSLTQLRDHRRFKSWVSTITRNTANSLHRQRSRESVTTEADLDTTVDCDAIERLCCQEDRQAMATAVQALHADDRALVEMLFFERVSYSEIAKRLKCRPGSIGPTRGRVLDRLRAQYLLACQTTAVA